MTVEEAKKKYGDPIEDGYIWCPQCPLKDTDNCVSKYSHCSGKVDAWEAIAKYMTETKQETPVKTPKRLKKGDAVDHPDHYNQGEIECIDAMIAAFGEEKVRDWCVMTSFKYHWRYHHKNGDEDIRKASWYIDKYKELARLE